jgi:hypothetical protein
MNSLNRLSAAVVLTLVLSVSVFAGEIQTPPCPAPDPGILDTPPCAARAASDDSVVPSETETPPASNTMDVLSVAEAAMNLMLLF